ncbi:hypothetical protein JHK85_037240 [Glycine max]|nr:hypothetical protein JHK85_037240 [Glycine max]
MDDLLQCTTASQLLKLRIPEQGTGKRVIELGSRLSPEGNQSSWASSSGHFAFGFYSQGDGFAVGIWLVNVSPAENTIVWTANRDSPPLSSNSTLQLTKTGLLFFQDGRQGQVLLSNFVDVTSSASMLDSGNFVLYDDTHNTVVWQSFEHPTDTILGGQNLSINAKLVSSVSNSSHSSGRFFLLMQGDGNLVAYPVNSPETGGDAYWASNTKGSTFQHLSLNVLGFLCLSGPGNLHCFFNHSISPGMKLQNKTSIYRSTVDVDGNLRLYEHQLEGNGSSHVQVLWSTPLKKCETKGFCGFNSYCSIVTGHAMCECFPGFVPSKSNGSVSLDCVLAHSKGSCKSSEDAMISYKITMLENMSFSDSDDPYWVSQMKKEECEKSFLEDCDCMAVLYLNGNCRKYRLPLTYGRTIQNQVAVALFKVPSGIVDSSTPNNSTLKPRIIVDNKKRLLDHSRMKNEDDETSKYLAPEWQKDAPISVKFDIYSFGMVLLEIVCRRRSIEMNVSSVEEIHLSSWVYQCFAAGQLNKLVKEDEGTVDWRILERMVKVGLWCVQDSPPLRPSIKNVILMLEGLKDIPIPPPPAETSLNKYS